jgi:hypothetical protein
VKGHDFSRANKTHKKDPGLSPRKISHQAQPADALYQGTTSQLGNNSTGSRCAKGLDFSRANKTHKKDPGLSPRKISRQAQPADALYQGMASAVPKEPIKKAGL